MNTSAEAADQIVRMSLNGAEEVLKISGAGAREVTKLLYAMLKDMSKETKKTKGQMRLNNLIKSGKKLEIYKVNDRDLKKFCEEAKKYGIVYTVLKDRNKNDGFAEVMVKSEDKQKIDHIYAKLNLAPAFPFAGVDHDKEKEKDVPERASAEKGDADKFIDEIMKKPNPTAEKPHEKNPTEARNGKESRSVPSSKKKSGVEVDSLEPERRPTKDKPSVRKELERLKKEQEASKKPKDRTKTNEHKAPKRKKKEKER